ncbi:hypothetical protein FEM48_Zijuj01G0102100 [Ziziphus jujuba var. spinosa]|uniref:EGF-like domain-containing protein n=1 Tax=Ziziphus jujuba var. spinosa TaxID=714518 RepID=A0A978W0N2_ZIZJJ|nr:hypothetical protein FEM48_Zijuj01G0102100 [Ziziphus jujuba var. spinosa]
MVFVARDCYDQEGNKDISNSNSTTLLRLGDFNIPSNRNKFTDVGCYTYTTLSGYKGKTNYIIGYAFVVEDGKFNFSQANFGELKDTERLPLILNWATGEESCVEAEKNGNFACKRIIAYVWRPTMGLVTFASVSLLMMEIHITQLVVKIMMDTYAWFADIDECKISNPCDKSSTCLNLPGNYSCICPSGDISSETGCSKACSSNESPKALVETGYYISIIMGLDASLKVEGYWNIHDPSLS